MGQWTEKTVMKGAMTEFKEHELTIRKALEDQHNRDTSPYRATRTPNIDDVKYIARQIAIDHLQEDPKYYQKLKKVGL